MAACTAGNVKVLFDHFIEGEELLTIIKEGFKHLIFLRRQLPLPFMLLEREQALPVSKPLPHGPKDGLNRRQTGGLRGVKARKRDAAILTIKETTNSLNDFVCTREIHAMALLFGSTIVSPREIFLMRPKFRSFVGEANQMAEEDTNLRLKRMDRTARSLIKNLVTNPELSSLGDLKPTNVFVFILAQRDANSDLQDTFLPKQGYQIPLKGKIYDIIMTNENMEEFADKDGISELLSIRQDQDLIWYQSKHVLRGFSETRSSIF